MVYRKGGDAIPQVNFIGPMDTVASGRLRATLPAKWLYANGYERGSDLVVLSKHCWPEDFTQGYDKYIFDVCDDHFETAFADHYKLHCANAAAVTCNSEAMAVRIKDFTGRDAFVIPDPFELERKPPHLGDLLWFGAKWNVDALLRVLPDLPNLPLEVVSEPFNKMVTPWSLESLSHAMSTAGIVLIPVGDKKTKSANRMIEAINGGCFVVAEEMPAHYEFAPFTWIGEIGDGVRWALDNPDEVLGSIAAGQDYIDKHYSMDAIGPMWASVIDGIG